MALTHLDLELIPVRVEALAGADRSLQRANKQWQMVANNENEAKVQEALDKLPARERVRQIKELALGKLRHPRFHRRLRAYADN